MNYRFLYILLFLSNIASASSVETFRQFSVGVLNPMQDVDLGVWDGESDISYDVGYCVLSTRNNDIRNFFQTNNSNKGSNGNSYNLSNSDNNILISTIDVYQPSRGRYIDIQPNVVTRVDLGVNDCSSYGQEPYFFRIFISADSLNAAPTGEYTATITTKTQSRRNREEPYVTDSFNIKVIKGNEIRVGQLKDIDLGTYDGVSTLQEQDTFCVYLSNDNTFNITFYDDSPDNGFYLRNKDNLFYKVPYVLDFTTFPDRGLSGNAYYNLTENFTYSGLRADDDLNCNNGQFSYLRVTVPPSQENMPSGEYYSTLNIVVSPD